jgi:hypothetical protein
MIPIRTQASSQLSAVSCQLSVISYQLLQEFARRPPAVNELVGNREKVLHVREILLRTDN